MQHSHLVNLNNIYSTLNHCPIDPKEILLYKAGIQCPLELLYDLSLTHMQSFEPQKFLNLHKIFLQVRKNKYSIKINNIAQYSPSLFNFCQKLAADFIHQISINSYYTPGDESVCFSPHIDKYNIIILQVKGTKKWYYSKRNVEFENVELINQTYTEADLTEEIILNEGDTLFLPAGTPHSACSLDAESFHLTVGFHPITIHNYLNFIAKINKQNSPSVFNLEKQEFEFSPEILAPLLNEETFYDFVSTAFYSNIRSTNFESLISSNIQPATVIDNSFAVQINGECFFKMMKKGGKLIVYINGEKFIYDKYINELEETFVSKRLSIEKMSLLNIPVIFSMGIIKNLIDKNVAHVAKKS